MAIVALLLGVIFDAGLVPLAGGPIDAPGAGPAGGRLGAALVGLVRDPTARRGSSTRGRPSRCRSRRRRTVCGGPRRRSAASTVCSIMQKLGADDEWHTIMALEADKLTVGGTYDAVTPGALILMSTDGVNGWAGGAPAGYRTHNGGLGWSSLPFPTRSMPDRWSCDVGGGASTAWGTATSSSRAHRCGSGSRPGRRRPSR